MARTKLKNNKKYYIDGYDDVDIDLKDEFPGRYKVNKCRHIVHGPDVEVDIGYNEYFNFGVQKHQWDATDDDEVNKESFLVNKDGDFIRRERRYRIQQLLGEL